MFQKWLRNTLGWICFLYPDVCLNIIIGEGKRLNYWIVADWLASGYDILAPDKIHNLILLHCPKM